MNDYVAVNLNHWIFRENKMNCEEKFTNWMSVKFVELGIDYTIFASYVESILTSDDTDDKIESLDEIFSELTPNSHELSTEFVNKYNELVSESSKPLTVNKSDQSEDLEKRLIDLIDKQRLMSIEKPKKVNEEFQDLKHSILLQCANGFGDEFDDTIDSDCEGSPAVDMNVEENRNALNVRLKERERKEAARLECQKKKDKDKDDREKQIRIREQKKEQRKTQKNERRR